MDGTPDGDQDEDATAKGHASASRANPSPLVFASRLSQHCQHPAILSRYIGILLQGKFQCPLG
jgi:hypothetical protein